MKLTVLVDNNTYIDRYFIGEPAASYLIETDGKTFLFDTGYSDAFIRNALKLNINLLSLDCVALSHGHNDHTWGLVPLLTFFSEAIMNGAAFEKPSLVAHPEALSVKRYNNCLEIGSNVTKEALSCFFNLKLSDEPQWLTKRLVFLGEIPRLNDFEGKNPIGKTNRGGVLTDDYLLDDTALAYKLEKGLVIITGCSHAGICNIVDHAKKICRDERVISIIGGLHLLDPGPALLDATAKRLALLKLQSLYACHCTDLSSKIALSGVAPLKEVGVGLTLTFE